MTDAHLIELTTSALSHLDKHLPQEVVGQYTPRFLQDEFSYNEADAVWLVPFELHGESGTKVTYWYANVTCSETVEFSADH